MPTFQTINPATNEPLAEYTYHSLATLKDIIYQSHETWQNWKKTSFQTRSDLFISLSSKLKTEKQDLAKLITMEMGKPISQSIAEIEKCIWACEYYAENSEVFLKNDHINTEASSSFITYQPLGTVLAIMPWNFPFWQVFRFAVPTLMAGNVGILKHAPNTTACAIKIEQLFLEAGFPKNAFTITLAEIKHVEFIIGHEKIAAVTLTGSTQAGKSVASIAGKYLKKTVLELGGSDPYIIMDDADLDLAAEKCVAGRLINTGQSCIAAKRFIVTKQNSNTFIEKVHTLMAQKSFGDPLSDAYPLGAIARSDLRELLHCQVIQSIEKGAKCLLGGHIPDSKGLYYPATLLTHVLPDTPAYSEELFGPVASIITTNDESESISIANDTSFGLGGALFTSDTQRAKEIATYQLEAGCVFVNDFVKSDPRLPFGGIKQSGYGRELSPLGIKEFINAKAISIV